MFTSKLLCSVLTSLIDLRKLKTIFPTISCKQFCLCTSLCLFVSGESRRRCFKLPNVALNRKALRQCLNACNFFLLCKDCKQTWWMPASVQAAVSGRQQSAWVTHDLTGFRFYTHENTRGSLWNLEVFYKKRSPVMPYFHCFNILL